MSVQKLRERKAHFFWVWARGYFRIRAWVPTDVRSWVSSVWQLAHSLLVTMTNFQYCKGSYSLAKKHKWMKWLAQASTCGKFMTKTHILWGCFFFSKTPLTRFCEWRHNEEEKIKNGGCRVSDLFLIHLYFNHSPSDLLHYPLVLQKLESCGYFDI